MQRSLADLRTLLHAQRWPDRAGIVPEYDAAVRYLDGDMQADTEALVAQRFSASQRDSDQGNRIESVAVALMQQYVDEMATVYQGTVERRVVDAEGNTDEKRTEIVLKEIDRIGLDHTLNALDRRVVGLRSCGLALGVAAGHVDPIVYAPQHTYALAGGNPANQDTCPGFVVDRLGVEQAGGAEVRRYSLIEHDGVTDYTGMSASEPGTITAHTPNAFLWSLPDVGEDRRSTRSFSVKPIMPFAMWHSTKPVGQLIPLGSIPMFKGNRWLNVLFTIVLDVIRYQAGATWVHYTHDTKSVPLYRAVGVRHPATMHKEEEEGHYEVAGNDYAGVMGALQSFARFLGMTLRLSPDDFSLERSPESGYARQLANVPKDRARAERIKWYALMESEYLWPRLASVMIWLGTLDDGARQCRLQTTFRPLPLPVNQVERIAIEDHDLKIGITTPVRIFAERNKIGEDQARETLTAMRAAEVADREKEKQAPAPITLEVGKVAAMAELVKLAGAGEVPADSAESMLILVYGLSPDDARKIIDPIRAEQAAPRAEPAQGAPGQMLPGASPGAQGQPGGQSPDDKRRAMLERLAAAKPKEKKPDESDGSAA